MQWIKPTVLRGGDGIELGSPIRAFPPAPRGPRAKDFSKCSRAASSGTTPPYSAWSLICGASMLAKNRPGRARRWRWFHRGRFPAQAGSRFLRYLFGSDLVRPGAVFISTVDQDSLEQTSWARFRVGCRGHPSLWPAGQPAGIPRRPTYVAAPAPSPQIPVTGTMLSGVMPCS